MEYINTTNYLSVLKNEILTLATKWLEPKDIVLSDMLD